MWFLVSQPNALVHEVQVDPKAKGHEILEKVCDLLGIRTEMDYFGLKYRGVKGHELWLNLRNPVERQVCGVQPIRLTLRVKFWVPPHLVLQETARHQMFLQAKFDLKEGLPLPESEEGRKKLAALLVQAESGDATGDLSLYSQWTRLLLKSDSEETLMSVASLHSELKGMKPSGAEYWVLKEISALENFGEELFKCKGVTLGIGPHGINIHDPTPQVIPYTAIQSASSLRRLFQLWYLKEDHTESLLEIKCDSCLSASGLYRALTEKHAFYSCDTVRNVVTSQYIRDLKGTIVSIFNEASPLGKKYVFDIRRTCREVHDDARRALYCPRQLADSSSSPQNDASAKEKLCKVIDALTCRVCMDSPIDTVFFPCSHVLCCESCASRCPSCPLCRSVVDDSKKLFLPTLDLTLDP